MDREEAAREIARSHRVTRKHAPGWVWALSVAVALACLLPLIHAWLANPGEIGASSPPPAGSGLGTGIALGFVAGVLVGFAVARARGSKGERP
jgi:hypothetical protein